MKHSLKQSINIPALKSLGAILANPALLLPTYVSPIAPALDAAAAPSAGGTKDSTHQQTHPAAGPSSSSPSTCHSPPDGVLGVIRHHNHLAAAAAAAHATTPAPMPRAIRAVLFDKDNTLTLPYENCTYATRGIASLVQALQGQGQGPGQAGMVEAVAILSNSVGSADDTDTDTDTDMAGLGPGLGPQQTPHTAFPGADEVERHLCLSVVRHGSKKPDCVRQVLEHFNRDGQMRGQGQRRPIEAGDVCMIGE